MKQTGWRAFLRKRILLYIRQIDQRENSKSCDFNGWIHWFLVDGRPRGRYPAKQAYFGINLGFWETIYPPLPWANINTYFSLKAKCWLRGRVGGQFKWSFWTLDWQRLGASQEKLPREKLILSLPDAFMMVAAINVPLGRAFVEKKKKKACRLLGRDLGLKHQTPAWSVEAKLGYYLVLRCTNLC